MASFPLCLPFPVQASSSLTLPPSVPRTSQPLSGMSQQLDFCLGEEAAGTARAVPEVPCDPTKAWWLSRPHLQTAL